MTHSISEGMTRAQKYCRMAEIIDKSIFSLSEPSDNAQVVYCARQMLARLGFDETRQYLVASAVSELSTNIIRYAKKGTISLQTGKEENRVYFEVIALDDGPGMANLREALQENFSTGNSLGLGLPSVQRIMDDFEIQSAPGQGTRITARKWKAYQCLS